MATEGIQSLTNISSLGKVVIANEQGKIDLSATFSREQVNSIAYGYTEVIAPQDGVSVLRLGSDDGIRVWINGEEVINHEVLRAAHPDQEMLTVPIKKGVNRCLVKVDQATGGWEYYFKLDGLVTPSEQAQLVALSPVIAPLLLTRDGDETQQRVQLSMGNLGGSPANNLTVTCNGPGIISEPSLPFSCQPGEFTSVSIPLDWKIEETISPFDDIPITFTAIDSKGNEQMIGSTTTTAQLLHPLLVYQSTKEEPFYIVQLSDSHILDWDSDLAGVNTTERLQQAVNEINSFDPQPDFIIVTGDFSHNTVAAYPVFAEIMNSAKVSWLATFGNHDKASGVGISERAFCKWGLPPYYSFMHKGVWFAGLDGVQTNDTSRAAEIDPRQLSWLEKQLRTTSPKYRAIFMHHEMFTGRATTNTDEVHAVMDKDGAEQWFFYGHWHSDSFVKRKEQHHIITTATGYIFPEYPVEFDKKVPGYRLIHFTDDGVKTQFKPLGKDPINDPEFEDYNTKDDVLRALGRLE